MPPTATDSLALPPAPGRIAVRSFSLLGPGLLVAVGYMDPGNWATDLAGGSRFGYTLLSVVLIASLLGILLQIVATRVAVATGHDLAELIRLRFPKPVAFALWSAIEVAMVATDLAELVGSAVGLKLLFGIPEVGGLLLTAAATLLLLAWPSRSGRLHERVVVLLVGAVVVCFAAELGILAPEPGAVLAGFIPTLEPITNPEMLYLSLGILGATVMPHNLFLHTGLLADRVRIEGLQADRSLARSAAIGTIVALSVAFLVNGAILIVGAVLPGEHPGLVEAHGLLSVTMPLAGVLFAVALVASGQSSTLTGTLAGQYVTRAFIGRDWPRWLRAAVTRGAALVPALAAILWYGPAAVDELLVASQVVLSLTLPLVLVPLMIFAGDRRLAGALALGRVATLAGWTVALGLGGLNIYLLGSLAG